MRRTSSWDAGRRELCFSHCHFKLSSKSRVGLNDGRNAGGLYFITFAPSSPVHIWLSVSEMWSWPMENGMRAGRSLDDELGGVFNSKLANFMIPAVAKRHLLPSSACHFGVLCHHYLFSTFLKSFGLVLFLVFLNTFLSKEVLCHYRRQVSLGIRK